MISEHVAFDAAPLGSILARECAAFSDLLIRGGPPPLMAHALVIRVDTEGVTQRVIEAGHRPFRISPSCPLIHSLSHFNSCIKEEAVGHAVATFSAHLLSAHPGLHASGPH